jgi:hypothetical protein
MYIDEHCIISCKSNDDCPEGEICVGTLCVKSCQTGHLSIKLCLSRVKKEQFFLEGFRYIFKLISCRVCREREF